MSHARGAVPSGVYFVENTRVINSMKFLFIRFLTIMEFLLAHRKDPTWRRKKSTRTRFSQRTGSPKVESVT